MSQDDPTCARKYEHLLGLLHGMDGVLVAYSGGVDSTLLAFATHAVLGERCLAVLGVSETYPPSEAEGARRTAAALGLRLLEVETDEMADPEFRANKPDRCYHCKMELFDLLRRIADARGLEVVVSGDNVDDLDDRRPGRRAAAEYGVRHPLIEAGMTKSDVREVARLLGLPNWDKPSMACLASRFPFGSPLDETTVRRVSEAEERLQALGLSQFRVRSHGDVARLEVHPDEMEAAWQRRDEVVRALKECGYTFVAQDLEGYRTGAMNEALRAERANAPTP